MLSYVLWKCIVSLLLHVKNKKLFTKNNRKRTTQIFVMAIIQCVCVRNAFSTGVEKDFYIQIIKINKKTCYRNR